MHTFSYELCEVKMQNHVLRTKLQQHKTTLLTIFKESFQTIQKT